ncbi:BadF/BadG/BcrA/BcrD ATPase family protein [Thiosulfatihalobacter marinus]|uniref:BadF/BadG/BcrA/BcrD ATPase family protein n=1 Tax=Thiosulfatihalobacter marinus TaxID=2792481 RepID=UPI0018D85F93|nr:BadF/BadG/BcrA/BcrD ATPase family protein [Thiosulfatihalobacter marinus]
MSESSNTAVLALDGGGTRCRLAYHSGAGVISVEAGSANVSTDFDGAIRQIKDGLSALAQKVGCPVTDLMRAPCFLGLAGVTGAEMALRLQHALPFEFSRIADDRPAALRGALGLRDGVVAHCGTGSFFAAQIDGHMRFVGGWGPVLGDEASAQWIGRHALRAVLDCVDDLRAPTPLSDRLLADHGGAAGIVRFAGTASPAALGGLAPLVTQFADAGDDLAMAVMRLGAEEIAHLVPVLGWRPGMALCLTGGIAPHFAPFLPHDLRASVVAPDGAPLAGALALAREFAEELANECN